MSGSNAKPRRSSRSRSRSPRTMEDAEAASSPLASAQPATAAVAATAAAAAAASSSSAPSAHADSDEDFGQEESDDNSTGSGGVLRVGPEGAARLFSTMLRHMQGGLGGGEGEDTESGPALSNETVQRILAGLQSEGLAYQDEDGNFVLGGDDDDEEEEGEDEEEEGIEDEEAEEEEAAAMRGAALGALFGLRAAAVSGSSGGSGRGAGAAEPVEEPNPRDEAAVAEYASYTHLTPHRYPRNLISSFASFQRDSSLPGHVGSSPSHRSWLSSRHVPRVCSAEEEFEGRAFCGKFSIPGPGAPSRFAAATQDGVVHLYETESWKLYKEIYADDVGWSIVDIDFSTDSRFVIYSSWSNNVHLINTQGSFELHEALDFDPPSSNHCCMFGIRFSPNASREILAGLNNGTAILYDIERKRKVWCARAHLDDINSVCWLDHSGNLFATGSDDSSIKIWDRRLLVMSDAGQDGPTSSSRRNTPVAGFLGHVHGLTCVAPMPDGNARYMLSNSKDQSMKLWDLRRTNTASAVARATEDRASQQRMLDYRWQRLSRRDVLASAARPDSASSTASSGAAAPVAPADVADHSVCTFSGHSVSQTLIRCDFSPAHSTGHRYAITGSANGRIHVFDVLTGETVTRIPGHTGIVRDVAWQDNIIVSASWDHSVRRYALHKESHLCNNAAQREASLSGVHRRAQFLRRMGRQMMDDDE